jgi:uracil-DNA glycosylase
MRLANPQVIVAVGERVMAYFKMQPPHKDWTWNQTGLNFENRVIPVVKMPHPGDRKRTEAEKNEGLTETFRQIREIRRGHD